MGYHMGCRNLFWLLLLSSSSSSSSVLLQILSSYSSHASRARPTVYKTELQNVKRNNISLDVTADAAHTHTRPAKQCPNPVFVFCPLLFVCKMFSVVNNPKGKCVRVGPGQGQIQHCVPSESIHCCHSRGGPEPCWLATMPRVLHFIRKSKTTAACSPAWKTGVLLLLLYERTEGCIGMIKRFFGHTSVVMTTCYFD